MTEMTILCALGGGEGGSRTLGGMSSVAGRLRVGLVTLGVVQLVWHGVFALVPGGGPLGCAPSVGQAARAGVQASAAALKSSTVKRLFSASSTSGLAVSRPMATSSFVG